MQISSSISGEKFNQKPMAPHTKPIPLPTTTADLSNYINQLFAFAEQSIPKKGNHYG